MPRILVIDDQKIPRMMVAAMLREADHIVVTAESGPSGLERARAWLPDVIVLDVNMPEMDGFEVVEQLKQDPDTAPTPVIFLTAQPPTDDLIVRGLDLGAYDFLSKGGSRAELLARVGVMARIKRSNDELSAIARISDSLIQSLDPHDLSQRFIHQVRDVFRADAALFSFVQAEEEPPIYAAVGLDAEDPLTEALARTLQEELARSGSDLEEVPIDALQGPAGVLIRRHDLRSVIAVRIERELHPPTLLAVFTQREEGFARGSDAPLLHLLARQATIAMDNALLHAHTRTQARKMEEQADDLERAMSERSRFFASMSHELRTPINAVIGYNQLLETGTYGELTEKQMDAVNKVSRSAQHLLELINDILDISKIEASKLEIEPEPTDLCTLLRDTLTSIQLQAEEKGLSLNMNIPEEVVCETDPARVRQILLNLLSNAVKFTDTGEVAVTLLPPEEVGGEEEPKHIEIRVTDTGPGIPLEDQERIFEEFEQTNGAVARGGTGLGLAISRKLAHLLGGDLHLESEVGRGSTFTLRLPR
jgi:signal transduction histidine kinase/CheY-like chemotaxis protein